MLWRQRHLCIAKWLYSACQDRNMFCSCVSNPENICNVYHISSALVWPIYLDSKCKQTLNIGDLCWKRRNNAIKFSFLCIIFVAVYGKLQWSFPMMIGSHQSELQFQRVVITWNHLYHTSLAKRNFARKCLKIHLFSSSNAILAYILTFCPSLVWLSCRPSSCHNSIHTYFVILISYMQ